MPFHFDEAPDSRQMTAKPPSESRIYIADGEFDPLVVKSYAYGGSPAFVTHPEAVLFRQDIQVDPLGYRLFRVTVPYAPKKDEQGEFSFNFDTTGGQIHIKASKSTVNRYAATGSPADHKQAIGVHGDNVDGVDIVIPAMKIDCQFSHPLGVVTLNYGFFLAEITGRVNSDMIFGRQPGEILFLGARGSDGTTAPATLNYSFAYEKNLAGLVFGAINGVQKDGWDYVWLEFEGQVSNGKPARPPKQVNVERVYDRVPLATLLGFGA
jgi:hypothetical protein